MPTLRALTAAAALVLVLAACSRSPAQAPAFAEPTDVRRVYTATAAVGDFLTLTIDPSSQTLDYVNHTTSVAGHATYSEARDGGLDVTDSGPNRLVYVRELGDLAIIQASTIGPSGQSALVFGARRAPLAKADLHDRDFVYLQLRTQDGIEVGHGTFDPVGNLSLTAYYPAGVVAGGTLVRRALPPTSFTDDPARAAVRVQFGPGDQGWVFSVAGGGLAVDSPNGAVLAAPSPPSTALDPARAGEFVSVGWSNTAELLADPAHTGTRELSRGSVTLAPDGHIRILELHPARTAGRLTLLEGDLVPFASSPRHGTGPGQIPAPLPGIFTFTDPAAGEVFVAFHGDALLWGAFRVRNATPGSQSYDTAYGIALRAPTAAFGTPFPDPTVLRELHCFGVLPWEVDPTLSHGGVDLVPGASAGRADGRLEPIVSPVDGLVEFVVTAPAGSGYWSAVVGIRMNPQWMTGIVYEPQSLDTVAVPLQQESLLRPLLGRTVSRGEPLAPLVVQDVAPDRYHHLHVFLLYLAPADPSRDLDLGALRRSDGASLPPRSGVGSPLEPVDLGIPSTYFCPWEYATAEARAMMDGVDRLAAGVCSCVCAYGSAGGSCGTCPGP